MSDIVSDDEGISGQSMCNNIILKLHQFQKKKQKSNWNNKRVEKNLFSWLQKTHSHTHKIKRRNCVKKRIANNLKQMQTSKQNNFE